MHDMPSLALPTGLDDRTVFRSLFWAYPDALLLVDDAGTIRLANPSASALLGYAIDELAGLTVEALVPDAIRPRHAAYREAYGKSPRARPMGTQMELVARRKDGSEVMVEIALSPLQEQGLPYVVAAIRDIGAYPRVKQALKRARYAEYVAQMGRMAVDARDPQLLLQQVPAVAAEALGTDVAVVFLAETNRLQIRVAGGVGLLPEEAVGALLPNRRDTPPGYVMAEGMPVVVDDYATEQRFEVPQFYRRHHLVSAMAVPLSDRGTSIGALAVRSRSRQHYGDDEVHFLQSLANLLASSLQRTRSEEALNHAQRLESVGQLTGGIAHDFNNLLTIIQGNLQVLEDHPALDGNPHVLQLVAAATRASKRGAELTGKLLAFSRRQVLAPSRVDPAAMLQSLADMLRRTLDQRIRISVEVQPGCPAVRADAGQLESALLNIAINARDAMPEGGTLSFRCAEVPELPVSAQADRSADAAGRRYVAFAVTDSGTGMPDAVKDRAFEPFFTTKEAGRGTGLGLSTVYGFARQSKGAISLDSAPGAGTTVTLYIPCFDDDHLDAAGTETAAGTLPPGLRVLVVEDESEVRAVVRAFLAALGCEATLFASAEQALMSLQDSSLQADLVLTDIALGPGMRGTELAREVAALRPVLPVLMMSGYSSELLEAESKDPSLRHLLRKPFTRQELTRAILRTLSSAQGSGPG
jgi:PAS domain S-box-containing protein